MTERPILFSAEMVRAILAGRKTQTRRLMKVQPYADSIVTVKHYHPTVIDRHGDMQPGPEIFGALWGNGEYGIRCPYGAPGDLLWVREAFRYFPGTGSHLWDGDREYQADGAVKSGRFFTAEEWQSRGIKAKPEPRWRPSIHMPRWASRITLEVKSVRVERLQDISEDDARAEGVAPVGWVDETDVGMSSYREGFSRLWDRINGSGAWEANPWVWVLSFERVKP